MEKPELELIRANIEAYREGREGWYEMFAESPSELILRLLDELEAVLPETTPVTSPAPAAAPEQPLKELDVRGFVFLDNARKPFLCRIWGGEAWLFRWHESAQRWVSLRRVTQTEVWAFPHNLTEEQQDMYRKPEHGF